MKTHEWKAVFHLQNNLTKTFQNKLEVKITTSSIRFDMCQLSTLSDLRITIYCCILFSITTQARCAVHCYLSYIGICYPLPHMLSLVYVAISHLGYLCYLLQFIYDIYANYVIGQICQIMCTICAQCCIHNYVIY